MSNKYPKRLLEAESRGDIEFTANDYAEPGYSSPKRKPILFANWNGRGKSEWKAVPGKFDFRGKPQTRLVYDDMTMPNLAQWAEEHDFEIEWSDEWITCNSCYLAVRTQADSYSWRQYYWLNDGEIICGDCVKSQYAEEYLESLENNPSHACTFDIDFEAYGYIQVNDHSFEHGMYGGQNADPKTIAKTLRMVGVTRFLFDIPRVGQFDIDFDLYVHNSQIGNVPQLTDSNTSLPYDIANELSKVLRGEHSDYYTVTTKQLTQEEFISGNWKEEA